MVTRNNLAVIKDPSELEQLDRSLSEPSTGSASESPARGLMLALLQPLANPEILAELNRKDGLQCFRLTGPKNTLFTYVSELEGGVDMSDLGKKWRKAMAKVMAGAPRLSSVTFDLTLPQQVNTTRGGMATLRQRYTGLCINIKEVRMLIATIATTTRMRMRGHMDLDVMSASSLPSHVEYEFSSTLSRIASWRPELRAFMPRVEPRPEQGGAEGEVTYRLAIGRPRRP
ncbi:hypothetical protein F4802DRAFT_600823 [Xylaria palmicola]|nr:hypothetical protein F4802DRAFT_600823 [Xylaria palmicola]